MKTKLRFVGLEAFSHHRDYIFDILDSTIARFDLNDKFQSEIVVRKESKKYNPNIEFYTCEINFFGDRRRGHLFFKKTSKNFYEVVKKTLAAAEKSLRRESKTRLSRMRKLCITPNDLHLTAA